MLVLAYCAGLRLGEIVRLNIGDVDFADRTINMGHQVFKSADYALASVVVVP
jgi:integrase